MACWDYANGEFIMELIHRYEHVSKLVELNEHMKAFINNQVEMDPEIQAIIYSNMEKLYVE